MIYLSIFTSYLLGVLFSFEIHYFTSGVSLINLLINLGIICSLFLLLKRPVIVYIIVSMVSLYAGSLWYQFNLPKPAGNDLYFYAPAKNVLVEGIISEEPKLKKNGISFRLEVSEFRSSYIFPVSGYTEVTVYEEGKQLNYGDKIRLKGNLTHPEGAPNPGEFDYREYLQRQGVFSLLKINSAKDISILSKETRKGYYYYILKVKTKVLSVFYNSMPAEIADLTGSLVFGSKSSPVAEDIQENFVSLGLAHVLAASGMQISLLMFLGLFFTEKLKINKYTGTGMTITVIVFYMALTGFPPSILRAGLVNIVILLVNTITRETADSLKVLFLTSFIMILVSPLMVFDIGFQFSVLATFALIYYANEISKKMVFLPPFISGTVSIIITAQMLVLPLQLYYFSQFSGLFLPANIIASLFVNILTYMSLITVVTGLVIPDAGILLGSFLYYFISLFLWVVELMASLPLTVINTARPSIVTVLMMYAIVIFCFETIKNTDIFSFNLINTFMTYKYRFTALLLLITVSLLTYAFNAFAAPGKLKVIFLNSGQADSTLIITPEGKNILVDVGQYVEYNIKGKKIVVDSAKRYLLPYLQHQGIKKIDLLVLTHPDSDHIGGFNSIAENVEIERIWDAGQVDDSPLYSSVLETALKKNIPFETVNKGSYYQEENLTLEVINEIKVNESGEEQSYNNNNAIALKLSYGKTSFLLMSDLEKEAEAKLLESPEIKEISVLKAGHHGSKTSSTEEFLQKVKPEMAVISCGKNNRYGHPHKEVVERFENMGTDIYRTDEQGGIVFTSDGEKLKIRTTLK